MDKVFIEGLEIECTIGIHDWERRIKQPIVLDIELGFDNRKAGASDAIADAIDYSQVIELVRALNAAQQFLLLESFVEAVCTRILAAHPASSVRIQARKFVSSLGARAVGVVLCRERKLV